MLAPGPGVGPGSGPGPPGPLGPLGPSEYMQLITHSLRDAGILIHGIIGEGVYGFVLAATNIHTQQTEAVKVMPPYKHCGVMPVNALREVTALTHCRHHNVTAAKGVLIFSDGATALRMSMYSCTLRTLLERHSRYFLPLDVVQYLFAEIVKGVAAMGAEFGLVHRDLKPENVLIRWAGKQVAVADWGMSRSGVGMVFPSDTVFTREVISKYYAPPETLAGTGMYTSTIDVWSLGVILAELIAGKMIFPHPVGNASTSASASASASSRKHFIVQSLFGVLGTPVAPKDIEFFKKVCRIDVPALPGPRRQNTLPSRLGRPIPPSLLDFLQAMFKFTDRPGIQDLLISDYVQSASFPPAGIPFSSCTTTPRMEPLSPPAFATASGHPRAVSIATTFLCASSDASCTQQAQECINDTLCGWNVDVFAAPVLYKAWLCLQSLGTMRQRTQVWLVAMRMSKGLMITTSTSTSESDIPRQDLLAATVSLAAASVMLVQRRFDVPFVKCIQPLITAKTLHAAECVVFKECRGYLPVCPTWVDQLITPAAMHIACESVCHGPEIQAIPAHDFFAACHCNADKDAEGAGGAAGSGGTDIPASVYVALEKLKDFRKRFV